MFLSIYSVGG